MTFQQLVNTNQFKQAWEAAEQEIYKRAYQYSGCNQHSTAKLLGVSRGTAITKLRKWKLI